MFLNLLQSGHDFHNDDGDDCYCVIVLLLFCSLRDNEIEKRINSLILNAMFFP